MDTTFKYTASIVTCQQPQTVIAVEGNGAAVEQAAQALAQEDMIPKLAKVTRDYMCIRLVFAGLVTDQEKIFELVRERTQRIVQLASC